MKKCTYTIILLAAILFSACKGSNEERATQQNYCIVQFEENSPWSVIDSEGKIVADSVFSSNSNFSKIYDGIVWVRDESRDDKWRLYNIGHPQEPISPKGYAQVSDFSHGRSFVRESVYGAIDMVDTKGKVVATLPQNITDVMKFNSVGLARCADDKECSYINTEGNLCFKLMSNMTFDVFNGQADYLCAADETGANFHIYNKRGEMVHSFHHTQYLAVGGYAEGKMAVIKDPIHTNGRGDKMLDKTKAVTYINEKGEELFTIEESRFSAGNSSTSWCFDDGHVVFATQDEVVYESRFGIANDKGEVTVPAMYVELTYLGKGFYLARKEIDRRQNIYKYGIIKADGTEVLPFEYNGSSRPATMLGDNFIMRKNQYSNGQYTGNYTLQLVSRDGTVKCTFRDIGHSGI